MAVVCEKPLGAIAAAAARPTSGTAPCSAVEDVVGGADPRGEQQRDERNGHRQQGHAQGRAHNGSHGSTVRAARRRGNQ